MSTRQTAFRFPCKFPGRQTLTLALTLCLLTVLCISLTWSALTLAAPAANATLTTTPDKCISLRKGQACYQKIRISWTTDMTGDYCVLQQERERPLRCWQNASRGTARIEIVARTTAILQLLDMSSGQEIATTQIKLAWVYKERKTSKRSWRLF